MAAGCSLQFADPQPDDVALADAYRRLYYPVGSGKHPVFENTPREVIEQALRGISQRLGSASRLRMLDYGCGKGELSKVAADLGFAPVGIEQDPEARRKIESESLFPVYSDLESLVRKDPGSQFDLVLLWTVIEHLRRPWDDLARLRGLLTKGGRLVASTANAAGLKARMLNARWDNYWNPTHLYYFTPQSLRVVFERAGLAAVEEWRLNISYGNHGFLRRGLHAFLTAARLDGDLFFAGSDGNPSATKGS